MNRDLAIRQMGSLRFKRNGSRDEVIGALIATPGYIKDQIESLNNDMVMTDGEIWAFVQPRGKGPMMDWYMSSWSPFYDSWRKFREDKSGTLARMWGSVLETNNQYRARLIDMRSSFKAIGGALVGPEPKAPEPGWIDTLGQGIGGMVTIVKVLLVAVVAGGIAVAIIVALRK